MLSAYNAALIENQAKRQLTVEELKQKLEDEYKELIKFYAQYDGFRIGIQDKETGNWSSINKLFRYHKITSQDYAKAKEMAQTEDWKKYAEPPSSVREAKLILEQVSSEDYIINLAGEVIQRTLDYYRFLASCYLHMSCEDFDRCDWSKLRLVIEACNYRTEHSLAPFSEGLLMFFMIENTRGQPFTQRLTQRDVDMLNMYQLWVGPSKLRPWDINGGIVYEEDISTFVKLEEYRMLGEKKREKIQQARENRSSGGVGGAATGTAGGTTMGEDGVLHKRSIRYKNR